MKKWTKLGIGIGALVLAIAAGTGAYAMRGGSDAPARDDVVSRDGQRHAGPESDGSGGSAVSAMCAEGVPDCGDVVVEPAGDDARCAADGPCDMVAGDDAKCAADGPCDMVAGGGACPPGMACIEPWLMNPPVCPDRVPEAECGWTPYPCLETGHGSGTAIAQEGYAEEGGTTIAITPMPPVDVTPVDPAPGMPVPCLPVDPCVMPMYPLPEPGVEDRILPMPAPCEPVPVEPCDDTGGARCLPPDCSVSSDGSIVCPDAPAPECPSDDPAVSCMAPGSEPPLGGGVDGSEPQTDPARE